MNYIVFDLECTCWLGSPPHNRQEIIEIGAVFINDYGEVEDFFSEFVRPVVNPLISKFCTELTGITQSQVNRAKEFRDVVERFKDWVNVGQEEYVLLSWGGFDKRMLASDCELHRLDWAWTEKHADLKKQYQRFKKLKNQPGLLKSVEREGFVFEGTNHRAIDDAKNTAKIFIRHLEEWQYY